MKASNNYLALRSIDGTYYINGNWRIDFPNDYEAAGTIAHYERIIKGQLITEHIFLPAKFEQNLIEKLSVVFKIVGGRQSR